MKKGFSLIEVILAVALFALVVTALVGAALYGTESASLSGDRARAAALAEEGLEALRNIRDASFADLAAGTYGLSTSTGSWTLLGSSDATGPYTRMVTISAPSGTSRDATSTVTWQQNLQRTGTVSVATRLTNWLRRVSTWTDLSLASWFDLIGPHDGLKVTADADYAYVVRAAGNPEFSVVDISNPSSPSEESSLNLGNRANNIALSGSYAYIASDNNSQELAIVNISNPSSPVLVGGYNAPGNANGLGVYAVGTTVYLVRTSSSDAEFFIINASNPALPTLVGSLELAATGYEVWVSGSYAYVASGGNANELQVINITVPALPVIAGVFNLSGSADAITLTGAGSTVFLGQGSNLTAVNVSTPSLPSLLGTFAAGGTVNDAAVDAGGTNVFLGTSSTTAEFIAVDASAPASMTVQASVNIASSTLLSGVTYESTNDRVYGAGNGNDSEFMIFTH